MADYLAAESEKKIMHYLRHRTSDLWKTNMISIRLNILMKLINNLQGSISNYVTNGSKTAVMDLIGFLCVSLDSSTVQLHDILGCRNACACSEAGFNSQNGDRA
jgi:hypothetical protein